MTEDNEFTNQTLFDLDRARNQPESKSDLAASYVAKSQHCFAHIPFKFPEFPRVVYSREKSVFR